MNIGLAYANARGEIHFDERSTPLADDGVVRLPRNDELIAAPKGTVPTMLPGREPMLSRGKASGRVALGALLPAGFTRLLLPSYQRVAQAPPLPLFGYTYACVVNDTLYVAARRTDEREDWAPRKFAGGELEARVQSRIGLDPTNRILAQLGKCATEYGCFTAQNVFLEQGEAAIAVSPKCNAECVGCISEQRADAGIPAAQQRIDFEPDLEAIVRIATQHLSLVPDGIVSFGQGCEGEPLLRSTTIAAAIRRIRATHTNGTINCNTNGSMPTALATLIDAGLDAVRISLNSFRPDVYAAYYRPRGYELADVLASIKLAVDAGLRVSLNMLTHPGVTDDPAELERLREFLAANPVSLIQTRTLNIDPDMYFGIVGRPTTTVGMGAALDEIRRLGISVGNFTRKNSRMDAHLSEVSGSHNGM